MRAPLCLTLGLLVAVAPSPAAAQAAPRTTVSGPAVRAARAPRPVAPPAEEQIYAELRRQLRTLFEAQDQHRLSVGRFAEAFGRGDGAVALVPPAGVTVRLVHADALGWAARAHHAALPDRDCVVWAGQVPPGRRPITMQDQNRGGEAEVVCDLVP